jgi:hypothetical protein
MKFIYRTKSVITSIIISISLSFMFFSLKAECDSHILYKSVDQTEIEFQAQKLAHGESIGFDEYQLRNIVPTTLHENLKHTYLEAQSEMLKSEISQLSDHWHEVVNYAYKADWEELDREMISIAFLRLAQLAPSSLETRKYILQAIEFDDQYKPDTQIFQPPIVEEFFKIKTQSRKLNISCARFKGFTFVLVNGSRNNIENKSSLSLQNGVKRVTFISPTYLPVTRVFETQNLSNFEPQKISAKSTTLSVAVEVPSIALPLEDLNPTFIEGSNSPSIEKQMGKNEEKSFYEKPKFWIGASVIAAGLFYLNHQNNSDSDSGTTHKEGL